MKTHETIQEQLSQPTTVSKIRGWLGKNKGQRRSALVAYLCEVLQLNDHRGRPRGAGVHKALRVLESRGFWELPSGQPAIRAVAQPRRLDGPVAAPREVPESVEQVQGLQLIEVRTEEEELFRTWNELILREHPLHDCCLVGRQLRYLIGSDHGWLGAIGFGSCALRLQVREEWIGWDEATRKSNQERVINMTRFLIRPEVRCQNLASRALSLCQQRVGKDYATRYGLEPWLLESFVDTEQHTGACYQAANWMPIGATAGLGRNAPAGGAKSPKAVYVYELKRDWRRLMGIPAPSTKIQAVRLEEAFQNGKWVEAEFGRADLGHQDSVQRLVRIAAAKAQNPSASYTECFAGNRHELKAYYRFIDHKREAINPQAILGGHRQRTLGRMKGLQRVLVLQDTTDLDFSKRLHCNGLGDTGKNQTGTVSHGLKMHSSLAVSEEGLPLGVLDTQIYAAHFGGEKKDPHRPIEEKESYRWLRTIRELHDLSRSVPETELICVGDRESDMYELFDYRRRHASNIHLLVRAQHNRHLEDEEPFSKLFDHLQALPVAAQAQIEVPRQREKESKPSKPGCIALPGRRAQVELKWDQVTLAAPATSSTRNLPALELYALSIVEPHPPSGAKALHWVLLTTVPISSRKQALCCLRWYTLRWRIEDWHRVLKSGCHIESHQHQTADRLARAISIDVVIAWRVMLLALLGREVPEIPCDLIFSQWECKLLNQLQPLVAPETMTEAKKKPVHRHCRYHHQPPWRGFASQRERTTGATDTATRAEALS
jgi:hypothetical protein